MILRHLRRCHVRGWHRCRHRLMIRIVVGAIRVVVAVIVVVVVMSIVVIVMHFVVLGHLRRRGHNRRWLDRLMVGIVVGAICMVVAVIVVFMLVVMGNVIVHVLMGCRRVKRGTCLEIQSILRVLLSQKLLWLLRRFIVSLLGLLLLSRVNVFVVMMYFLRRLCIMVIMVCCMYVCMVWLFILEMHLLVAILNRRLDCRDVVVFIVIDGVFMVMTSV